MTRTNKNNQASAILQWQLGDTTITVINDSRFTAGEAYFTHVPPGVQLPSFLRDSFRDESAVMSTNVFLIQSEQHAPVLIDAGMGKKFYPAIDGRLLDGLALLHIAPEDIGYVLLTHLHGDHYYGLLDGEGQKAFPNAKIWVNDRELDYWYQQVTSAEDRQNAADIRTTLELYDRVSGHVEDVLPGFSAVPLPGHTAGQTGFRLRTETEDVLFCADILSLPVVQAGFPEIGFATDWNYEQARQTRIHVLTDAAEQRLLLAGPHFEFPCLHYVTKQTDGSFRLIPKQWL